MINQPKTIIAPGRAIFKQLVEALNQQYAPVCEAHNLKPSQIDILFLLLQGQPVETEQIAEACGLSQTTCGAMLRDLEAKAWIGYLVQDATWMTLQRAEDFREDIVQIVLDAEAWVSDHLPEVFGKAGK